MKFVYSVLVLAVASTSFAAPHDCAQRVVKAGCYMSHNDQDRINQNIEKCKQVKSKSGATTLEVFLVKKSDKVVVIQTEGQGTAKPYCPAVKYTVDNSGVADLKIIANKTFILSNDGQLYYMLPDQHFYEVMNSKGKSYSGITEIKGHPTDPNQIVLVGKTFTTQLSMHDLAQRKTRALTFFRYNTQQSLFHAN